MSDRDLDGVRPDPAGGADDQHLVAGLDPAGGADRLEGGEAGDRQRGGLLEGESGRLAGHPGLRHHRQLGEGPVGCADDLVPDGDGGDLLADLGDDAGHVAARNGVLGTTQAEGEADGVGVPGHQVPGAAVHAGGADAHDHVARTGGRVRHLGEGQLLAAAVAVLVDGSHDRVPLCTV